MLLNDAQIRYRVRTTKDLVIEPFVDDGSGRRPGVLSYGLGPAGVDLRLGRRFAKFTPSFGAVIDPKAFPAEAVVWEEGESCLIPPNSFILAEALEYIALPRDLSGLVVTKSSYARCGVVCPSTDVEPGWRGRLTVEIANETPLPARVYAGEGAFQLKLYQMAGDSERCYGTLGGRYQDQPGLTLPTVRGRRRPTVLLAGRGRCGKDTLAAYLAEAGGLRYAGSLSWYAKEFVAARLGLPVQVAWEARHQNRALWRRLIDEYRAHDASRLIRQALQHAEIVPGVRARAEFEAARRERLFDHVWWVERAAAPADDTLEVGPEDCDHVLSNDGSLDDLRKTAYRLVKEFHLKAA